MVAGMNNLSTLLHPSALGNLVIFPLGLELAYHLTSFNYCLQSCSQFSTGQVPTAISRLSAIGLVITRIDIRCYLSECWKLIQPKVVLKLGNLRSLADQYESLPWGKK